MNPDDEVVVAEVVCGDAVREEDGTGHWCAVAPGHRGVTEPDNPVHVCGCGFGWYHTSDGPVAVA